MTEVEVVGWPHQLKGHEFAQTPRDGEEQGRLVCCSPWGHKESDMTEQLNNKMLNSICWFFAREAMHMSINLMFHCIVS